MILFSYFLQHTHMPTFQVTVAEGDNQRENSGFNWPKSQLCTSFTLHTGGFNSKKTVTPDPTASADWVSLLQDTWGICYICCRNVASWVNDLTSLSLWVLNKKRTGLGLWLDSQSMWEAPALILWTAEEGAGKRWVFGQDRRRFAWDMVHGAGFLLKAFLIAYTVWIYSARNRRPSLGQMQTCPSENCT